MTFPLLSMSWMISDDFRFAACPFVFALSNAGFVRFGSAAKPALVPMSSGVSSIHSAVACVELYGTVVVNVWPFVVLVSVIFQTLAFAATSVMSAWKRSPRETGRLTPSDGPGMISHHPEQDARPMDPPAASGPVRVTDLPPAAQPA